MEEVSITQVIKMLSPQFYLNISFSDIRVDIISIISQCLTAAGQNHDPEKSDTYSEAVSKVWNTSSDTEQ